MSTRLTETQESEHLADVLRVIARQTAELQKLRAKGSSELIEYRKYMWEDAALFDRAERIMAENLAMTQESAVTDVALRLKRLGKLFSSAYFGRIDFREKDTRQSTPVYVGLHGLIEDHRDILIYDWRAPISGMFYDYEVGPAEYEAPEGVVPGEVSLKRQYKIEQGRMLYMFDSSLAINDEILRDTLARNTSEKMRQIVNSIQKEQNAIIRNESSKVLVVQGPAGSGKTSIAMHRAAYLLYRHRGHVSANNLLIFSPNEVFADYISSVLPELGEENIREATFDDYARSILGKKIAFETKSEQMEFILRSSHDSKYALRTSSIAFKASPVFLTILRAYARHLRYTNLRFEDIRLNNVLVMPGTRVKQLYREHCWDLPLGPAIERLKDRVLAHSTYSSEIAERKIEREVEKVMVERDPVRLYRKLFNDPALLLRLADGEPLPQSLYSICRLTRSVRKGKLPYEDVAPILLLKRLIDDQPSYANIRHLIIDEAQDYTPVHFDIIHNLFGSSSITILGDVSQRINAYSGMDDYSALRSVFGKDGDSVMHLTKSYRSSKEITDFAHAILPSAEPVDNIRAGGAKPSLVQADDEADLARRICAEMDRLLADGCGSIGVICKTTEESLKVYSKLLHSHDVRLMESDSIKFHHGLVVLPVYLAKGLEFDAVIIHDASDAIFGHESERKLLYTACTRALHSLTIYCTGIPSRLLPLDDPELYDRA